jgi:hypothetical protein
LVVSLAFYWGRSDLKEVLSKARTWAPLSLEAFVCSLCSLRELGSHRTSSSKNLLVQRSLPMLPCSRSQVASLCICEWCGKHNASGRYGTKQRTDLQAACAGVTLRSAFTKELTHRTPSAKVSRADRYRAYGLL